MALVYYAGFDDLAASQFTSDGWSANPNSVTAGTPDGNMLRLSNVSTGTVVNRALPSSYATVIVGFKFRTSQIPTTNTIFRLLNGTTRVADLQVVSSSGNQILKILNAAGAQVALGTTAMPLNTLHYIEWKVFVNGASGSSEVILNGATEIASTTGNFGSLNTDHIQISNSNSNASTTVNTDFDDLYVINTATGSPTTYLSGTGFWHIQTIYPNGAGSHTQWTPDSGSNYARVNEATPDSDTSYVSDATVNDRDSYTFGNLTSLTSILSAKIRGFARKDDVATRQIALVSRPTTTDYDGATQTMTTTYTMYNEQVDNNPDTSSAWTISDINSSEFGIKVVA